jgi:hypothetical protein
MVRNQKRAVGKLGAIILAVLVIAVAITAVLGVYATSHNVSTIENEIAVAQSGTRIIDDTDGGFGRKEVTIKNEGASSPKVLIRVAYSETWTKSDGTIISNVVDGNNVVIKDWTTAFVSDFVDGGDGWYYYKKVLNPASEVKILDSITLNDSSYSKNNYDLSFRFESVQADAAAASALWAKTVTVSDDGVVTWAF